MLQRIDERELASRTGDVIDFVRHGDTVIIEKHGEPEAALLDVVDYHLLRAALNFYTEQQSSESDHPSGEERGLSDEELAGKTEVQERYNLAVSRYLGEEISSGRMAEVLEIPWLDLRMRLARLGIQLHVAPRDEQALLEDIRVASSLMEPQQ